jgi:hypothetical protein
MPYGFSAQCQPTNWQLLYVIHSLPNLCDLTLTCTGIRALPNIVNQKFTGFTNVAILRYFGALPRDPNSDASVNIPTSVLPLKETDLHVRYIYFFPYEANNLNI